MYSLINRNRIDNIQVRNSNNCVITHNYIFHFLDNYNSIYSDECSELKINNNIIGYTILSTSTSTSDIYNNIIGIIHQTYGDCRVSNSNILNNIIYSECYTSTSNNIVENNIIGSNYTDQTKFGNGNIFYVDCDTLFVGQTDYSTDGRWQLKEGSAAIGAGKGGVDCGAFSGDEPYILSGIPFVPNIYGLKIEGTKVTIKVKANK